ncbi:hypothetical protein [Thomasclavelia sp.]|uniref:hypothetical protein n=1 Tax=Thomasclavelia sp. TaxID=3025757 RepID=UPI0025E5FD95|nr:hypothetical protein [Thomasclavelia sp.]
MMNKLKRMVIYLLVSYLSIFYLFKQSAIENIDYLVITASLFAFLINNLFLSFQFFDINQFYAINVFIIIRISKNVFRKMVVKRIFDNTLIVLIFAYIIPIFTFYDRLYSLMTTLIYLMILYLLFCIYDLLIIVSFEINNNILKLLLRFLPFILNIMIQINFFQYFYQIIGGVL